MNPWKNTHLAEIIFAYRRSVSITQINHGIIAGYSQLNHLPSVVFAFVYACLFAFVLVVVVRKLLRTQKLVYISSCYCYSFVSSATKIYRYIAGKIHMFLSIIVLPIVAPVITRLVFALRIDLTIQVSKYFFICLFETKKEYLKDFAVYHPRGMV